MFSSRIPVEIVLWVNALAMLQPDYIPGNPKLALHMPLLIWKQSQKLKFGGYFIFPNKIFQDIIFSKFTSVLFSFVIGKFKSQLVQVYCLKKTHPMSRFPVINNSPNIPTVFFQF